MKDEYDFPKAVRGKLFRNTEQWQAFQQVVERTKARNANAREEIDAAIDEALAAIRAAKLR